MIENAGPLYPNQPLAEVATEIRFRGKLRVEQVRAEFQTSVADRYRNLYLPRIDPKMPPAMQHYRFESEEERCGVQLAVNSINVYARDYPGFRAFSAEVARILNIFIGLVGDVEITRVGWRYVNAIPFPREEGVLPFRRVFTRQPWLASALEGEWEGLGFTARTQMSGATVNLRLAAGTEDDAANLETLVFDIDSFSVFTPPLAAACSSICMDQVSRMHEVARNVFELSISDDYRRFLLGEP